MGQQIQQQSTQIQAFQQLFDLLQNSADGDVDAILRRIRRGDDPDSILRAVHDGDPVIQPWLASAAASNDTSTRSPIWSFAQRERDLHLWVLAPATLGLGQRGSSPMSQLLPDAERRSLVGDRKTIQAAAPLLFESDGFEDLVDDRFDKLSARTWTLVPCEDGRFADLLRLYFMIEHPLYAFPRSRCLP